MHPLNRKSKIENRKSNASALLMVVGLLVIIAMLGITFVVISHVDLRQAEAIALKAPVDPIADGIVKQISALLKEDLHIDKTNGPYGDYAGAPGAEQWRQFIDYPYGLGLASTIPSARADPWLASIAPDAAGNWPHLTDLTGDANHNYDGVSSSTTDPNYVDTDGDGLNDALLYNTGVTNADGDAYWSAVRIIDLGGLLNVNTAGEPYDPNVPGTSISPTPPANIDLLNGLFAGVTANYDSFHNVRCGGTGAAVTLQDFYNESASRILQPYLDPLAAPNPPYLPFGIGDEMHLRYVDSTAITERTGRLYEATKAGTNPLPDTMRQMLTTFNCSRSLTRHPSSDIPTRILLNSSNALDDDLTRQAVYDQLLTAIDGNASPATLSKETAAHFVANLWANVSADDPTYQAFKFSPTTDSNVEVYGAVPDLVISEAYAYNLADSNAPFSNASNVFDPNFAQGDYGYIFAIEIYNPTNGPIDLEYYPAELRGYSLRIDGFDYKFDPVTWPELATETSLEILSGKWIVLTRYAGKYMDGAGNRQSISTPGNLAALGLSDPVAPDNGWVRMPTLNLTRATNRIQLIRDVPDANDPNGYVRIPVDQLVISDDLMDFNVANIGLRNSLDANDPNNNVNETICDTRRDDDSIRGRLMVPWFERSTYGVTDANNHKLGEANALTASDLGGIWEGFHLPVRRQGALSDMTDLADIYIVGATPSLSPSFRSFHEAVSIYRQGTYGIAGPPDYSRGRIDYIGAVPTTVANYPDLPWASVLSDIFEVLPPDTTRTNNRIYGRVNINTATREVLAQLPWPNQFVINSIPYDIDPVTAQVNFELLIEYILAYRDMRATYNFALLPIPAGRDYGTREFDDISGTPHEEGTLISGLRADPGSASRGFLTASEIAIPLADFVHELVGWTDYTALPPVNTVKEADYLSGRDSLYKSISNLISVNSDVFAANIVVQLRSGDAGATLADPPKETWRYLSVLDRSNCRTTSDSPAVLLFTELE